ncbi:hypothetical protein COV04_01735 [Candidatus Uhrbacteria bacterium CG10_big_fil_rev_8_21_14_0_10_48_11]|uniref:ATP synthase subunit b n=1 Tax=Candidatus Uhrbacteria bacterium CG10_big_fil_rev_8_21_14_0_10_48_11 TaxID=1975037 RepID=A0A2M8LF81_9BACT|nr:MAG: hypothetical protein COV04_01735 [Candidatus Uhrbacteria bacterium CG10_big_fil_rev_8_21_14_0_10_48_11]
MDLFIHTALAAEEAASGDVAGTLGLNLTLFLAQLLNFGLLIVALWFLLFKPMTRYMAERAGKIQSGLENAKKADRKLAELEVERRALLAKAESEATAVLEKADDEAKRMVVEAATTAERKAEAIRERAAKELAEAKEQLLLEVKNQAADLVTLAAQKALGQYVTADIDKRVVSSALKEAEKQL